MKIGVLRTRFPNDTGPNSWTMKIINRTILGIISCFLLSAGLSKAAQQFDPLTKSAKALRPVAGAADVGAMTCTQPCFYQVD
jgi:hypothetical protein